MRQLIVVAIDYPMDECKIPINDINNIVHRVRKLFKPLLCEDDTLTVSYYDITAYLEEKTT